MAQPDRNNESAGMMQVVKDDVGTERSGTTFVGHPSLYSTSMRLSFGMPPHRVTIASSSPSSRDCAEIRPTGAQEEAGRSLHADPPSSSIKLPASLAWEQTLLSKRDVICQ